MHTWSQLDHQSTICAATTRGIVVVNRVTSYINIADTFESHGHEQNDIEANVMLRILPLVLLCSSLALLTTVAAEENITQWRTLVHDQGYCALYGICGHRADGDVLSCPLNAPGQQLSQAAYNKLQTLCPQLTAAFGGPDGHYCCTEQQIDVMATSVCCASTHIAITMHTPTHTV